MKSVINFRDLAKDNEDKVKSHLIYRSGHLDKIRDIHKEFSQLNINTIIDLRGPEEKKKRKHTITTANRVDIPLIFDSDIRPDVKKVINKKNGKESIYKIIRDKYAKIPMECMSEIKKLFEVLANEKSYPLVFHCRAGKDRTGLISAILLHLLKVDDRKIYTNYLESNLHFRKAISKYLRVIKIASLGIIKTDNIDFLVSTQKEYLAASIETIEKNFGSITKYLLACGVTKKQIDSFITIMGR